nr:transcription factor TGA9-like isoform X2 [Nicotiana tomentosiformis]
MVLLRPKPKNGLKGVCMASEGIGETGLTNSGPSNLHNMPYAVFRGLNPASTSFMYHSTPNNQEGSFDFGELEEAFALQGFKINNDEAKASLYAAATGKPAATLDMFPSWPMRFQETPRENSKSREEEISTDSGSLSSRAQGHLEPESPISRKASSEQNQLQITQQQQQQQLHQEMSSDNNPRTENLQTELASKPNTEKTLRRLAQNREAAKKSRLRKKAYVQQLESSRIRLSQLEQELQRARSQGVFLGGGTSAGANISSGAALFDMEYSRWLDDDHRHMSELRTALQTHLSDGDLRLIVDGYIAHYDEIFSLKGVAAKCDVFHLITGAWTTPAERCFLWMGGFRPSELIKMLIGQLDPLTEQQLMGIYSLQQSSQQAEEALSQGLEQLQQSLIDTVVSGSINDGMHHMALALGKLSNLEGFVRQADNLRQQTLHQLHRILTVRQAARCFLVIGEYYGRLRALSSLWLSRPRETLIPDDSSCQTTTELQMVHSSQNHFSNF